MIADLDPNSTSPDSEFRVQGKGSNCCSSYGGAAQHSGSIFTPAKVFLLLGHPWIEKWNRHPGFRVYGFGLNAFCLIAEAAGKPEVLFCVWPAQRLRDDMFQCERNATDYFLRQTVTATMPSLGSDP